MFWVAVPHWPLETLAGNRKRFGQHSVLLVSPITVARVFHAFWYAHCVFFVRTQCVDFIELHKRYVHFCSYLLYAALSKNAVVVVFSFGGYSAYTWYVLYPR